MSSPQSAPILIVGVANIAKALGVSPRKVRYEYLMHPDFPARKEKAAGSWISTPRAWPFGLKPMSLKAGGRAGQISE